MKLFEKTLKINGRTHIYFCGIKILSYKTNMQKFLWWGKQIPDWNNLPITPLEENTSRTGGEHFYLPKIAIIYPAYYQHNDFSNLYNLIEKYEKEYSEEGKKEMEIILVDDGSKFPINLPKNCNLNISLLRILKDIPWNNSGARNLGVCYTNAPKIILADIDFFVPEDTMLYCKNFAIQDNDLLTLTHKGKTVPHPNIFAMTKRGFMKVNGYDEQWCGFYGEDIPFRIRLEKHKINFIGTNKFIINMSGKEHEHSLSRNLALLESHLRSWDGNTTHKMLQFPWTFVEERKYKGAKK